MFAQDNFAESSFAQNPYLLVLLNHTVLIELLALRNVEHLGLLEVQDVVLEYLHPRALEDAHRSAGLQAERLEEQRVQLFQRLVKVELYLRFTRLLTIQDQRYFDLQI